MAVTNLADTLMVGVLIASTLGIIFSFIHLILDHVFNVLKDIDTLPIITASFGGIVLVSLYCFLTLVENDEDCQ